jgi:hypothetical protein
VDVRPKLDRLLKNHEAVAAFQEDVHNRHIAVVAILGQPFERSEFIFSRLDDSYGRQLFQKFGHLGPK